MRVSSATVFLYVTELKELEAMLTQEVIPWKERWKQEGIEAGIQLGIVEGIEKGLHTGMVRQLRRQLSLRFGPLPEWVDERLNAADVPQLEEWADRILDARTMDDVFQTP
jgi:hypothetical protein